MQEYSMKLMKSIEKRAKSSLNNSSTEFLGRSTSKVRESSTNARDVADVYSPTGTGLRDLNRSPLGRSTPK